MENFINIILQLFLEESLSSFREYVCLLDGTFPNENVSSSVSGAPLTKSFESMVVIESSERLINTPSFSTQLLINSLDGIFKEICF